MGSQCKGKPLPKCHDELACHAQGEKRNDIIRLLNCWVDTVEGNWYSKKEPEPCQGSLLCYPEFSCKAHPHKQPLCVKGTPAPYVQQECDTDPLMWKRDALPMPVWERPRVKSNQLIAGEIRKVVDCFRANGLNDLDYCPRTKSCQLMKCLNQMIAEDMKNHGREAIQRDCCCRPGDLPSRTPQHKCHTCYPPSPYEDKSLNCPPERGPGPGNHMHHCHNEHHDHGDRSHHKHEHHPPPDMMSYHSGLACTAKEKL